MLQGTLSARGSLADVIRLVYTQRHSGILSVQRNSVQKKLFFQKGSFSFSETNESGWRLGELLVAQGVITEQDLEDVLALAGRGRRIGQVLRELDLVSEAKVAEMVRYQILEIVYPVFGWKKGTYSFEKRENPVAEDIALALSTANVVMEGVRRIEDPDFVRAALGATDKVVVLGSNPLLRFQSIFLKPKEGFILSRIDGVLTIEEICSISPVPEEETLRCLYGLFAAGILEMRTHEEHAAGGLGEEQDIAGFFTELSGLEAELQDSGAVVVEERELTPEEQKERREVLAFHDGLEEMTHEEVLGVELGADSVTVRKAYYQLAKRYHPDRHHRGSLVELQEKLEAIFVRVNEAYEKLREGGSAAAARAREQAAKRETKGPSSEVADAARRQAMAEESFRQGRTLYEAGDYFGAVQAFRTAVNLCSDKASYHSYLGRAAARNPKWRREAEAALLKAREMEPSEAENYAYLGQLYAAAGLLTKAARLYAEALKWDPDNRTAQAGRVALEEKARKRGGSVAQSIKGLFGERKK